MISLHADTLQPAAAMTQERGHAGATMQELTLDGISGNCESGDTVVLASQVVFVCTDNVTKFVNIVIAL